MIPKNRFFFLINDLNEQHGEDGRIVEIYFMYDIE